jgi:hypothetical protein
MQLTNRTMIRCALCMVYIAFATVVVFTFSSPVTAALQDPTPDVPSASECSVEPRAVPSPPTVEQASPTPSLSQAQEMSGPPADDETVAEVTETVRGSIACSNAGDILRSLAYFTDAYVERMFSGENGVDYQGFLEYAATPPAPVGEDQQLAIIEITDVQQINNDLVKATVVTGDPSDPFTDILFFVKVDDQWLINSSTPVLDSTATPAP